MYECSDSCNSFDSRPLIGLHANMREERLDRPMCRKIKMYVQVGTENSIHMYRKKSDSESIYICRY